MTAALRSQGVDRDFAYVAAFADWLACASAGASERAARAMLENVAWREVLVKEPVGLAIAVRCDLFIGGRQLFHR
jgi:hypothetical protein